MKTLAVVCGLVLTLVGAMFLLLWIQNVDYYPQFEKIKVGMSEREVEEILGDIRVEKGVWSPGISNWFFQEPDSFPSWFFNVQFRDGRVIRKEYDL